MIDTLRADHISLYGYDRGTTPFIDRFASEAVAFERARSQAACTCRSVNSFLTSRYPFVFTRQGKGQMGIPYQYPAIAEILKRNGYQTIAVHSNSSPAPGSPSSLYLHYMDPHGNYATAPGYVQRFARQWLRFDEALAASKAEEEELRAPGHHQ